MPYKIGFTNVNADLQTILNKIPGLGVPPVPTTIDFTIERSSVIYNFTVPYNMTFAEIISSGYGVGTSSSGGTMTLTVNGDVINFNSIESSVAASGTVRYDSASSNIASTDIPEEGHCYYAKASVMGS